MRFKALIQLLVAAFNVFLVSCVASGSFIELVKIGNELSQKYGEQVSVGISNSKHLNINLTNSPKTKLPEKELGKYSLEIALYVYDNFKSINDFSDITINYVTHTQAGIVYVNSKVASFESAVPDLAVVAKKRNKEGKTL
jgi:hypothetical protein